MEVWHRETQWRQGFLLDSEASAAFELYHALQPELTLVIVATHDCDLSQNPQSEPKVEVVVGRQAAKDGNYTHAKNARKLHLAFTGEPPLWGEFVATDKRFVDKLALNKYAPRKGMSLSPDNKVTFQKWLASRYRRAAFADEFDRRLTRETDLAGKIAKAVKPHGELISAILFDVDDGLEQTRIGPDDTYTLDIVVLYPDSLREAEKAALQVSRAMIEAFENTLYKPLTHWQHIELRYCEPMSESALTYAMFKRLKPWRLEHLSLATSPQQPIAPD